MTLLVVLLLDLASGVAGTLSAEPLRGPFASLDAACDGLRTDTRHPDARCGTARNDECSNIAFSRTGPFAQAQFFRFANMCWVALRLERGWYVGETSGAVGDRHRSILEGFGSAGARVVIRIANDYWWHDDKPIMTGWWDRRRSVIVCGLANGTLACTSELEVGWSPQWEEESGERAPHRWRWLYDARVDGGALVVRARSDAPRVPPSPFYVLPTKPRAGRYMLPF